MKKLLFILFLFISLPLFGMDLYVSTTGNDSVSRASNTISAPWLTPKHAWDTAQAGDIVYFRGGTYNITAALKVDTGSTGYNGTGSGWTATNPITFKNYSGETPIFRETEQLSWMLRIAKNYNIIDGITFDINNYEVGICFGYDESPTGLTVQNCTFYGIPFHDSHTALYIGTTGGNYVTIKNNTITFEVGVSTYSAGILIYNYVTHLRILNNAVYNGITGISYKHSTDTDQDTEIAYNYINGASRSGLSMNCSYGNIHDNIIITPSDALRLGETAGAVGDTHNTITHNTLFSLSSHYPFNISNDAANSNNIITNNIFTGGASRYANGTSNTFDYNLYPSGTVVNSYTLTQWKAAISGEVHAAQGAPTFVGGGTPTTIAGFALTGASVGYHAASDGKDMGADVTLVGPAGGSTPTAPTSVPTIGVGGFRTW